MSLGQSTTVTLNSSGQIGLVVFDANAGTEIDVLAVSDSMSACLLHLFDPHGIELDTSTCLGTGSLSPVLLPTTGTYTLGIESGNGTGGTVSLSLYGD